MSGLLRAGSPIEPGDRIVIDAEGAAHAAPRRHTWNGAGSRWLYCTACEARQDDYQIPCPGPGPAPAHAPDPPGRL